MVKFFEEVNQLTSRKNLYLREVLLGRKSVIRCKTLNKNGDIESLFINRFTREGYIYETDICQYHEVLKQVVDGRSYMTGIIHRGKVNQGIVQAVKKKNGNPDYLRTVKDNTKINNLENVPECKET